MKRYRVDFGYGRYFFDEREDGDWVRFEDHEARVRQELSLAEEGLANYAQENEQLKAVAAEFHNLDDVAEIRRLRAALQTYGSHGISCPKAGLFPPTEGVGFVCTCGFEAITAPPQTCDDPHK